MSLSHPEAPPLSASEEIRSGWVFERLRPKRGLRRAGADGTSPRPPMAPIRAAVLVALLGLAVLAVWFVLYALYFSSLQESHNQHVMYTRLRAYLGSEKVPFGGVIKAGTPVMYITSPAIGLHAVVVEGTSSKELAKGPGHFPATPFPGQAGTSKIFGRSATFGSPFGKVNSLRPGQLITVTTGQGVYTFTVIDVRGPGDPKPSPAQLGVASISLETSVGSGWRSGWAPTHAILADAAMTKGTVQPTPPDQPTGVVKADRPLAGDTGDLVPLVLWLQAMVLLAGALTYAHGKWSAWQMWLVGLPTVLAVLWGATSTALLLLPNLA
jgi:sortase A